MKSNLKSSVKQAAWTSQRMEIALQQGMLYDQYRPQHHTLDQQPESRETERSDTVEEIEMAESVEELREQLANMKRLMEERKDTTLGEISRARRAEASNIIDGNFLSWVFGLALVLILSVSVYAFYSLYDAVLRKFPSHHTEL